jgi:hypothetical protein
LGLTLAGLSLAKSDNNDKSFLFWRAHLTLEDLSARALHNDLVLCEACASENCEHVEYALNLPTIQRILSKKGWAIEDGKITKKPY